MNKFEQMTHGNETPEAQRVFPAALSYCHMFNPRTKERMWSIPCESDEMAIVVGRCQRLTINIVEGSNFCTGYDHGEFLFRTNGNAKEELRRWIDHLGLKEKNEHHERKPKHSQAH